MDALLHALLDVSRRSDGSLTRDLADQLRSLIANGRLEMGERLPSSRTMARSLGISRNTISQAIEQLVAEGYVSASRGRRPVVAEGVSLIGGRQSRSHAKPQPRAFRSSFWAQQLPRTGWPPTYGVRPRAFQPGLADEREFPHNIWGRCLRHAAGRNPLSRRDRALNDPELQKALLEHLADNRGIKALPEQVFIVPSAQCGIALIAKVMLEVGDVAWIESPGYGGAFAALQAAGAKVVGTPIDANGLKVDQRRDVPRIIFVTPSHQYPTGRLMPVGRRLELLQFARKTGAAIIEDDYDGEFHYEGHPVAALAGLDPNALVFYLGTFTKAMFADIRVGYLVVPQHLVPIFGLAQRHLGSLVTFALQIALADFIASGAYRSNVRRMTRIYRERRNRVAVALAAEAGKRLSFDIPAGGMQLLVRCDASMNDVNLSQRLEQAGVTTRPLSEMLYHTSRERGLFLGFAAWNEMEIDAGAHIIGRHVR